MLLKKDKKKRKKPKYLFFKKIKQAIIWIYEKIIVALKTIISRKYIGFLVVFLFYFLLFFLIIIILVIAYYEQRKEIGNIVQQKKQQLQTQLVSENNDKDTKENLINKQFLCENFSFNILSLRKVLLEIRWAIFNSKTLNELSEKFNKFESRDWYSKLKNEFPKQLMKKKKLKELIQTQRIKGKILDLSNGKYFSVKTKGDGNCFFNSFVFLLWAKPEKEVEKFSLLLRIFFILKLVERFDEIFTDPIANDVFFYDFKVNLNSENIEEKKNDNIFFENWKKFFFWKEFESKTQKEINKNDSINNDTLTIGGWMDWSCVVCFSKIFKVDIRAVQIDKDDKLVGYECSEHDFDNSKFKILIVGRNHFEPIFLMDDEWIQKEKQEKSDIKVGSCLKKIVSWFETQSLSRDEQNSILMLWIKQNYSNSDNFLDNFLYSTEFQDEGVCTLIKIEIIKKLKETKKNKIKKKNNLKHEYLKTNKRSLNKRLVSIIKRQKRKQPWKILE